MAQQQTAAARGRRFAPHPLLNPRSRHALTVDSTLPCRPLTVTVAASVAPILTAACAALTATPGLSFGVARYARPSAAGSVAAVGQPSGKTNANEPVNAALFSGDTVALNGLVIAPPTLIDDALSIVAGTTQTVFCAAAPAGAVARAAAAATTSRRTFGAFMMAKKEEEPLKKLVPLEGEKVALTLRLVGTAS